MKFFCAQFKSLVAFKRKNPQNKKPQTFESFAKVLQ